jgi:hypothetical protein
MLAALPANAAPEVQANTFMQGAQEEPAIAKLANGYIVVWASDGQDGSGYGIYGQRYTLDGARIGAELHISETTAGDQLKPRVAGLADGGFVVVWRGDRDSFIYATVFRANGLKRSGEVRISTAKGTYQPTVAALANGGFVVIWDPGAGINGRLYDSHARPVSDEFVVRARAFSWPAVAALADGGFVAVWGEIVDDLELFAQRYDSSGTPVGTSFQVTPTGGGGKTSPAPIGLSNGGFVVVWDQFEGTDPNAFGIRGQRFSSRGAARGAVIRVNTWKRSAQINPSISAFSDGGFVVAWSSLDQDGSGLGVYGQAFNSAGARSGTEFRLNIATLNDQKQAVVAADRLGRFLAAWSSPDANRVGIFTRRFVKQIQ